MSIKKSNIFQLALHGNLRVHCKVMQVSVFLKKLKPYRFRLLAGVLFCILLISTWFLFSQKPDYPEEVHVSLQEQLRHIIRDALYNKEEGIHSLQFQKMQTAVMVRSNRIKAEFQYSFLDKNKVKVTVVGIAHMKRNHPDSETRHDIWLMDHFETKPPVLEFNQPIVLLSGKREKMSDDESEEHLYADDSNLENDEDNENAHLSEQKEEEKEESQEGEQEDTASASDEELSSDEESLEVKEIENAEEQLESASETEQSVSEAANPSTPEESSESEVQ